MKVALEVKRLGPGGRFANFRRQRLRHRAFHMSFALSFLSSQETRDSSKISDGNLGFWFGRGCFLVSGRFLGRGDRGCGEKGWEKWLGKEMIWKETKCTRSFIFASTGDTTTGT
jgi:hypothetical protein